MILRICGFLVLLLVATPVTDGALHLSDQGVACDAYPDPHFRTWDGLYYDYHRGCDLILIANPDFPGSTPHVGLDLHIRTQILGGYSGITSAALRIGSDTLEIMDDGKYSLNQATPILPSSSGPVVGGINAYPIMVTIGGASSPEYEVQLFSGQFIRISKYYTSLRVQVIGNGNDFSDSKGLCGTWSLTKYSDRSGGELFPNANDFGDHWHVDPSIYPGDPLLFINPPPNNGSCTDPDPSHHGDEPQITQQDAMDACRDVVGEQEKENCVFDVMTTGDSNWANLPVYNPRVNGGGVGEEDRDVTCKVYPDPHFKTWDNIYYNYHLGCDLILIKNPGYNGGMGLDLHIRTAPMGGYSGITNAALRIGDEFLEINNLAEISTNKGSFSPPPMMGMMIEGNPVSYMPTTFPEYKIMLPDDQVIRISKLGNSLRVEVHAHGNDFHQSKGLCGTWGIPKFMDRTGTIDFYPNENPFGNHWHVDTDPSIDPELFSTPPQNTDNHCSGPPSGPGTVEGVNPDKAKELAQRECAQVLDDNERRNCEFDVETTGDPSWATNPDYIPRMDGGSGGDPHFHTFHGEYFGYHGVCDLVLVHSSDFANGLGLDIHIRTEERKGYSSISNAAIRIGSDVLEVVNDGTYFVNGLSNAALPAILGGIYAVTKKIATDTDVFLPDVSHGFTKPELDKSTLYDVDLGGGENIQVQAWKDYLWVNVRGSSMSFEDSVGLMGSWSKPGKIARDGVRDVDDPTEFGEEWQVLGTEPKLFQSIRSPQHPEACLPAPVAAVRRRLGYETHAEEACSHVHGPKKEFCVFDVMATGDVGIARVYGI